MTNNPIQKLLITEKTTTMGGENKYVFAVERGATKAEIKKAVRTLYKVDPIEIRTLNQQPIRRRYRGQLVLKQAPKKAIVTLKEGQKIEA